jgi:hypothetical protein
MLKLMKQSKPRMRVELPQMFKEIITAQMRDSSLLLIIKPLQMRNQENMLKFKLKISALNAQAAGVAVDAHPVAQVAAVIVYVTVFLSQNYQSLNHKELDIISLLVNGWFHLLESIILSPSQEKQLV